MKNHLEISRQPLFEYSSLIIGWDEDVGKTGKKTTDFLISKLGGQYVREIDPSEYFPLCGVTVEDDVVQFPESKFYACPENNLLIFKSEPPDFEWYNFFNQVLDTAENFGRIKEMFIVGGMVSLAAHTQPRQLLATFSSIKIKEELDFYDLGKGVTYESAPGEKPTLNSFLLWTARKRNISGVTLWVQVPFYLMSVDDPASQKSVLEFFNQHFRLGLDLSEFDTEIHAQNRKLIEARHNFPDIDDCILRLEDNIRLSEDDNLKLVKQVEEYIKGNEIDKPFID